MPPQLRRRASLAAGLLLLSLASPLPVRAPDAATAAGAPAAPATRQVWHFADELQLTAEQRAAMARIRSTYETAREEVARAAAPNTPPDVKRAAQLELNSALRRLNHEVAALLTPAQKEKFAALRAANRPPARARDAAPVVQAGTVDDRDVELPLAPVRPPTRPELSPEAAARLAAELRAAYSRPPAEWPTPTVDEAARPHFRELGLLPLVAFPAHNPYSDAKAELGRQLFFDPRLSGSGQIACASCHDPDLAFADGRTVSFGHGRKELKRNAPTILNAAFNHTQFWDGRAASLEQQAADVLRNDDEMRSSEAHLRVTLGALPGYTNAFAAVFGSPEITLEHVAQAIATFERTVTSRSNPFDNFLRGETNALSDAAVRGLHLFRTDARCLNCHNGPEFTDHQFHNEGLTYYGRKLEDLGRYEVTQDPADVGKFKTPTLRNIARTAPYMHNGLFDLDGVLNMYNAGMPNVRRTPAQQDDPLFPVKSPLLQPLGLNRQELADLKAFLEALTETRQRLRPPALPPGPEETAAK